MGACAASKHGADADADADAEPERDSGRHAPTVRRRLQLGVCENILGLLWPLAIGLAVDGLIDGSRAGLRFFVGLSLSNTAVSFVRQRYESRTFNRCCRSGVGSGHWCRP